MDKATFRYGVQNLIADRVETLIECVGRKLAAPDSGLAALDLLELGAVYVGETRSMNPSSLVQPGDVIRVHASPRRFERPSDLRDRIVSETEETLLVDKPAGLPLEPLVDNFKENLLVFLEEERGQPLFLTHRLETETEGLVLVAKTAAAQARVKAAFADGRIIRRWAVFVERAPTAPSAILTILAAQPMRGATDLLSEGRHVWKLVDGSLDHVVRLEVEASGLRPQELRSELARLGAPVIGDGANGSSHRLEEMTSGRAALALRAIHLGL